MQFFKEIWRALHVSNQPLFETYRILNADNKSIRANLVLRDEQMEIVKSNIRASGGDPIRITMILLTGINWILSWRTLWSFFPKPN